MSVSELKAECSILKLIFAKFNAQHRGQMWWKKFAVFLKHTTRLCRDKLKNEKHLLFFYKKIVPATARSVHAIFITGSFITVGFALLASIARITTIITPLIPHKPQTHQIAKPTHQIPTPDSDFEDLGEAIDIDEPIPPQPAPKPKPKHKTSINPISNPHESISSAKKPPKSDLDSIFSSKDSSKQKLKSKHKSKKDKSSSKSKSKSKKSTIDDIFG